MGRAARYPDFRRQPKESMDLQQCLARADYHIKRKGICFLAFDLVDHRTHMDRFYRMYDEMMPTLNRIFAHAMPENALRTYSARDTGFVGVQGDKGVCGVDSVDAVRQIITYQTFAFPDVPVRWVVGEDGWDQALKRI